MQTFQSFAFHNSSVDLSRVPDIRFAGESQEATAEYGKPVRIFQTQGLQVIGLPPELTRILSPQVLRHAEGVQSSVTCHFETEQGFYLLRTQMVCHLSWPR